jgi:hypothetical protein
MVKKIRILDEIDDVTVLSEKEMQEKTYEFAKSMDWKLWEILQIMQRLEKTLSPSPNDVSIDEEISIKAASKSRKAGTTKE